MKFLLKLLFKLNPEYMEYRPIIWKNKVNNLFGKFKHHKYLFILSPPYCGSTLLNEIISTSSAVSVNNPFGTREGQQLPTVRHMMFDHKNRWNKSLALDWNFIKKEWHKYWDLRFPILLEKSPPNIIRAEALQAYFDPAYFVIFHRNPYAHCQSIIRRYNSSGKKAAKFAIDCLEYQRNNIGQLNNHLQISYEDLTNNPIYTKNLLKGFLKELNDVDVNLNFTAHNYKNKHLKITNLNDEKIKNLSNTELKEINSIFNNNQELLDFFGYKIIE